MTILVRCLAALGLAGALAASAPAAPADLQQHPSLDAVGPKGEHNPHPPLPDRNQGGPDGFGYRWCRTQVLARRCSAPHPIR